MLLTVAELEARYGPVDAAKAAAHIDDVSAEVVDYVTILDTGVVKINPHLWTSATAPKAVKGVVARVVYRGIRNPLGVTGEQLGDHNLQMPAAVSGGTLGPKDRRIIRRAVRRVGVSTVGLTGYLPVEHEFVDDGTP